ncbi:hypothetical protein LNKW23_43820 [Paralimibaculum aggregatum]|uniref:Uncharacterized protein n=1 Tax=Paralimibaculum aggregatum TaxID=3036245 RepID=A0ABQ6LSW8_9RHOB|nr:hypothetical protein LNKW23_43820 [Limibaculum sp. NKW23]
MRRPRRRRTAFEPYGSRQTAAPARPSGAVREACFVPASRLAVERDARGRALDAGKKASGTPQECKAWITALTRPAGRRDLGIGFPRGAPRETTSGKPPYPRPLAPSGEGASRWLARTPRGTPVMPGDRSPTGAKVAQETGRTALPRRYHRVEARLCYHDVILAPEAD